MKTTITLEVNHIDPNDESTWPPCGQDKLFVYEIEPKEGELAYGVLTGVMQRDLTIWHPGDVYRALGHYIGYADLPTVSKPEGIK